MIEKRNTCTRTRPAATQLVLLALVVLGGGVACDEAVAPSVGTRTYRMGFSAVAPRLTVESILETIDHWTPRADAALMPFPVPWKALLSGTSAAQYVVQEHIPLADLYRDRGLALVVMVEPADGLAREREAPELVALGRSITEPEVQALYHSYVLAVDSLVRPAYLGLAVETNLIRVAAPDSVYAALREMAGAAAEALRARGTAARLYVSVQVETAWGRLPETGRFVGVEEDLADFPFLEALALSSYPYLGGFEDPEQVPLNYYSRLSPDPHLPVLVTEGGWSSEPVGGISSSPGQQARWIRRQMELADDAAAAAIFQITYTDLDVSSYGVPGSILPLFAYLGLVDTTFQAKPALAEWDRAFARPLSPIP